MSNSDEGFPLDLFLSGDREAGRIFFEKYGGLIRNAVLKVRIKSDVITHEDVFQGAVAHLFDKDKKVLRMYKGASRLSSYIYQVSYNYALTTVERENNLTGRFDKTPIDDLDSTGQEKWLLNSADETPADKLVAGIFGEKSIDEKKKAALQKALKMFSEKDQKFIDMLYKEKRSTEEIMIFFGLNSPNSVYSKKNKLLVKLEKLMKGFL
jgi:RNA polymerase sigma factor (sigma-70 family)